MKVFGVYVDYTNEVVPRPFYVGKGNLKRIALIKRSRNLRHVAISKAYGIHREIVMMTIDESFAYEFEIELIEKLKTRAEMPDHWGANYTAGGEGVTMTPAIRKKISDRSKISSKGERNPMYGKHGKDNPNFGQRRKGKLCTCRHCQKEFWLKLSKIKCGKGKYCSRQCYLLCHPNTFKLNENLCVTPP